MEKPEHSICSEFGPSVVAENAWRLLRELACEHLDRATVVFFGSRAAGEGSRRSDFDIAYLPGEGFDPLSVVRLREEIEARNVIYRVDLVDLSRTSNSFREKVMAEGVLWRS